MPQVVVVAPAPSAAEIEITDWLFSKVNQCMRGKMEEETHLELVTIVSMISTKSGLSFFSQLQLFTLLNYKLLCWQYLSKNPTSA